MELLIHNEETNDTESLIIQIRHVRPYKWEKDKKGNSEFRPSLNGGYTVIATVPENSSLPRISISRTLDSDKFCNRLGLFWAIADFVTAVYGKEYAIDTYIMCSNGTLLTITVKKFKHPKLINSALSETL